MKELDLLLARYLRDRWTSAPPAERACFERFLELPDPELAAYLVAGEPAADAETRALVEHLRGAGC